MFGDSFFKKVEGRTNVSKETIMSLAKKLQNSNMKDEGVLRDVIKDLSKVTGKDVSEEKTQKIVNAIVNDNVPKDVDKMF